MKVVIDPDICIGCELCPSVCSEIYRMEGNKAIVYLDPIPDQLADYARNSAVQCPVNAISIIET